MLLAFLFANYDKFHVLLLFNNNNIDNKYNYIYDCIVDDDKKNTLYP